MLNPSTADAEADDPTIRKCISFAKEWRCGALIVVNLYPYRATDPRELKKIGYMRGREYADARAENLKAWKSANARAGLVIAAWGTNAQFLETELAKGFFPYCCRIGEASKDGHPQHPLYLPLASLPKYHFQHGKTIGVQP